MPHFNDSFARSLLTYFFDCDICHVIISHNGIGHSRDSIAVQFTREILIIGSQQNVYWTFMQSEISKCITNCVRIIYSAISNAAIYLTRFRYHSSSWSRRRRILSGILYDGRVIKAANPDPVTAVVVVVVVYPENGGAFPRSGQKSSS